MKIVLGAAQFGSHYGIANKYGKVPDIELKKIINDAKKYNIRTIDTAVNYGDCEKRLGKFNISDFNIISKLPSIDDRNLKDINKWISNTVGSSLDNLKIKRLEAILLHKPEDVLSQDGNIIINALDNLKENNLINKTGISIYNPEELKPLLDKYNFDIVQTPLNVLDRRIIESGWLNKLKEKNIEVHARSVFLQGLLLLEYQDLNKDFFKNNKFLLSWMNWVNENKLSPYKVALEFIISNKLIDKFLVGVDNYEQFQELIRTYALGGNNTIFPNFKCQDQVLLNPSKWQKF